MTMIKVIQTYDQNEARLIDCNSLQYQNGKNWNKVYTWGKIDLKEITYICMSGDTCHTKLKTNPHKMQFFTATAL